MAMATLEGTIPKPRSFFRSSVIRTTVHMLASRTNLTRKLRFGHLQGSTHYIPTIQMWWRRSTHIEGAERSPSMDHQTLFVGDPNRESRPGQTGSQLGYELTCLHHPIPPHNNDNKRSRRSESSANSKQASSEGKREVDLLERSDKKKT